MKLRTILLLLLMASTAFSGELESSFNAGELSPLVKYRVDIEKRNSGVEEMENMLVKPQGAAARRPGTEYIGQISGIIYPSYTPYNPTVPENVTCIMKETNNIRLLLSDGDIKLTAGGVARSLGGSIVGLPCVGNPFVAGQRVQFGGTTSYSGTTGFVVQAGNTINEIVIDRGFPFAAETFDGDESVIRILLNVIDTSAGYPCVIDDYNIYFPTVYVAGGSQTCLFRMDGTDFSLDGTWADAPPAGWGAAEYGRSANPTSDGAYIYLLTIDNPSLASDIYKYQVSDGSCVWKSADSHGSRTYGRLGVDSDDNVYGGYVLKATPTVGYWPAKFDEDGNLLLHFIKEDASGNNEVMNADVAIHEKLGLVAFGCGQYYGGGMDTHLINIFDLSGTWQSQFGTQENGKGCIQLQWVGNYLYALMGEVTYDGDTVNIFKFDSDLNVLASSYIQYGATMWRGTDGNMWFARDDYYYDGDEHVVVLDIDNLSEIKIVKTNQVQSNSNYILNPDGFVLSPSMDTYWSQLASDEAAAVTVEPNDPIRLIPFEYSTDDSYVLAFGHQYIGFYRTTD